MSSQPAPLPTHSPRRSRWPKIIGFICAGLTLLVVAAALIPCLLVEPNAANESSAVNSLRTIATAQIHFSEVHPEKGSPRPCLTSAPLRVTVRLIPRSLQDPKEVISL